jgi:hypothetical protein
MAEIKALYEFTVTEKTEKEVPSTIIVDEKEVKTLKTEIVESPIKVFFKKPSRRDSEDGELFYAKKMNEFVNKHGLMTRAMLYNKYKDSGGLVSEETIKELVKVNGRLTELQEQIALIKASKKKTAKQKDKIKELEDEYMVHQAKFIELEQYKNSLMENTADEKAVNEYIRWLALNMTYIQREDDEQPVQYFAGADLEAKMEDYYLKEDSSDEIYAQVSGPIGKASAIWYMFKESDTAKFKEMVEKTNG